MATFLSYFLFWFYFVLSFFGAMLGIGCVVFGVIASYDAHVRKTPTEDFIFVSGIAVSIVGLISVFSMLAFSKFVLNPIWISLPSL